MSVVLQGSDGAFLRERFGVLVLCPWMASTAFAIGSGAASRPIRPTGAWNKALQNRARGDRVVVMRPAKTGHAYMFSRRHRPASRKSHRSCEDPFSSANVPERFEFRREVIGTRRIGSVNSSTNIRFFGVMAWLSLSGVS